MVLTKTQTTNSQRSLFIEIPNFWAWGDKLGWNFLGYFGYLFSANLSAPILVLLVPCPCSPLVSHFFYKKLSLYIQIPNIWDWDLNLGFSHCVSTVHFPPHHYTPPLDFQTFLMSRSCTKPCKILSPWLNLVNVYMKVRLLWKIFQSIIAPWGITHANPPWFTPRNGLQWLGI